jgi:hypothetical protein
VLRKYKGDEENEKLVHTAESILMSPQKHPLKMQNRGRENFTKITGALNSFISCTLAENPIGEI